MRAVTALSHTTKVRLLYKTCLKLHRGLPAEMKPIGDAYVRDEFKRHKQVDEAHAAVFLEQWAKYAVTLNKQLGAKNLRGDTKLGESLTADSSLSYFNEEQIVQLYELYQETHKPRVEQ